MAQLIELFGFLSVLLRATTLAFQSLTIGGILFSLCVVRPLSSDHNLSQATILKSCGRRICWFALALALAQTLSVTVSSAVLMVTAELPLADALGANFFLAGAVVVGAALG